MKYMDSLDRDSNPEWWSTKRAAAYLGITLRTLYRLIDEGRIDAYRFGRVYRLRQADVEAFVQRARVEPGSLGHLYESPDDESW